MKHAFLIIAHNKYNQLKFLVELLDNPNNSVYILIDKKAVFNDNIAKEIKESCKYSKVTFIKRMKIFWSHYSQVQSEMELFISAFKKGYDYYHLLSGIDLPIQPITKFHSFIEEHKGKIFIDYMSNEKYEKLNINNRIKYRHLFPKLSSRTFNFKILQLFIKIYRKFEIFVQKILFIDNSKKLGLKGGWASNWVSIDHNFLSILLKEQEFLEKTFKNSLFSDETFIPLIIEKYNYFEHVYKIKEVEKLYEQSGNLRFILWEKRTPIIFGEHDEDIYLLNKAVKLNNFFARKFDIEKYPHVKNWVLNKCKEK